MQLVCHCQDCRDATGNDYSTTVFFNSDGCQITGDTGQNTYKTADDTLTAREFCRACGTFMFDKSERFTHLIGVFTDWIAAPFETTPQCLMWTDSRLPHVTVHPDLKAFPKGIS